MGERALSVFLEKLGVTQKLPALAAAPILLDAAPDADARQKRAVAQLVDHTQRILRDSERQRDQTFWKTIKSNLPTSGARKCAAAKQTFGMTSWEASLPPLCR